MPHPEDPIGSRFCWITVACLVLSIAFCVSPIGTWPSWWTPSFHGAAFFLYSSLLLRSSVLRLGGLSFVIAFPIAVVAPYFISISTLIMAMMGPMVVFGAALGMALFIGLPFSLMYKSGWPAVVSSAAGFSVVPIYWAAQSLQPANTAGIAGGADFSIVAFSLPLHLGAIVSIFLGHRDATRNSLGIASMQCASCGYDLSGLDSNNCPECGEGKSPIAPIVVNNFPTPKA